MNRGNSAPQPQFALPYVSQAVLSTPGGLAGRPVAGAFGIDIGAAIGVPVSVAQQPQERPTISLLLKVALGL